MMIQHKNLNKLQIFQARYPTKNDEQLSFSVSILMSIELHIIDLVK